MDFKGKNSNNKLQMTNKFEIRNLNVRNLAVSNFGHSYFEFACHLKTAI